MMQLAGGDEVFVRRFDDQGIVWVRGHLQEALVQQRHNAEIGDQVLESLSLDDGVSPAAFDQCVITAGQAPPLYRAVREPPGISLRAVDGDAEVCARGGRTVPTFGRRCVLDVCVCQ